MPDLLILSNETCWHVEPADRAARVVDAAGCFRAVKTVMLRARHTVMLLGWDSDTRILPERESASTGAPNTLGGLLSWIADRRPHLGSHGLRWALGVAKVLGPWPLRSGSGPAREQHVAPRGQRLGFRMAEAEPSDSTTVASAKPLPDP